MLSLQPLDLENQRNYDVYTDGRNGAGKVKLFYLTARTVRNEFPAKQALAMPDRLACRVLRASSGAESDLEVIDIA